MNNHLLRFNQDITYCFLDLETLNLCLNFCHNRPLQVGILEVKFETILTSRDIRVDWSATGLKISTDAARITRFNQEEHDRLAIDPKIAFNKFWPILEKSDRIVIQNGFNFDLYLLRDWARLMGKPWKGLVPKIIDTNALARGLKLGIKYNPEQDDFTEYQYRLASLKKKGLKTNLAQLAKDYKVNQEIDDGSVKFHEAMYDVITLKKIWDKMKFEVEI